MIKRILFLMALAGLVATAPAATTDVAASLASRGLLLTLFTVFGAGILVSLTPCVYPMIPITLTIIGARSSQQRPIIGFTRSLVFVLGIAIIYSALGLVVAKLNLTHGFLLQNKWLLGLISVFFIAMGLSMLDLFTIQLPATFAGKLQSGANRGGYLGAFLVGIVTGIVASPCGSPVLASVLLEAAKSGNEFTGTLLLFFYALGIGMLFLILGTFPSFLHSLPKSGVWMEDIKKFLGLVLIGIGIFYLKTIIPALLYWCSIIVASLVVAALVTIKSNQRRGIPMLLAAWRVTGAALAAFAVYVAVAKVPPALAPKPETAAVAPLPAESTGNASHRIADTWLTSEAEGQKLAQQLKMPLMVDFTADWCGVCHQLDRETFSDAKVKEKLSRFVKVRIDLSEESEEGAKLQQKYHSVSLPTVAFVNTEGKLLKDLTLYEFEPPAKFLERVAKVK